MSSTPDHIEIIARALITRSDPAGARSILLCRNLEQGYFYLPGGHVEPGESAAEAVKREIMEELSLSARIGTCRLLAESRFEQGGKPRHEINLVFHVEHLWTMGSPDQPPAPNSPTSTETKIAPHTEIRSAEPHIAFEWIPISRLDATDLRPATIRDWITTARPKDPIRFISASEH